MSTRRPARTPRPGTRAAPVALLVAALLVGCASPAPSPPRHRRRRTHGGSGRPSPRMACIRTGYARRGHRRLQWLPLVWVAGLCRRRRPGRRRLFARGRLDRDGGRLHRVDLRGRRRLGPRSEWARLLCDQATSRPSIFAPAGDVSRPGRGHRLGPRRRRSLRAGAAKAADYGELPAGAIVLDLLWPRYRRDQVLAAQAAGVAGFVAGYGAAPHGAVPRATLIEPDGLTIPAIAAAGPVGDALGGHRRRWWLRPGWRPRADDPGAHPLDPRRAAGERASTVVMLGAHLDSVLDGPGLNDDGRASRPCWRSRARCGTRGRARRSGWPSGAARSSGCWVEPLRRRPDRGSAGGHRGLPQRGHDRLTERLRRRLPRDRRATGSAALGALLDAAVERAGGVPVDVTIGASSDHVAFAQAGIPIGGLFSGASEPVTEPRRRAPARPPARLPMPAITTPATASRTLTSGWPGR